MGIRLIVIGAGRIGTDLVNHISKNYDITCVDEQAGALEGLQSIEGSKSITLLQGDATSRLTLEKARVNEADVVVLTTAKEMVNLEAARILREKFSVPRVISIGITSSGIAEFEALQVEVVNIFEASAHSLRNIIQSEVRTPQGIGLGLGEILELSIHPRSRLVNKPLERLVPLNWRIGLIYRDDAVMVPDGSTRLMPNDRVIILGDPSVLKTVSELLAFTTHDFPVEYGTLALVYLEGSEGETYFAEVEYVLKTLPFGEVVFMLSPAIQDTKRFEPFFERSPHIHTVHISSRKRPMKSILESAGMLSRNCGLIIGDKKTLLGSPGLLPYRWNLVRQIARSMEQLYAPVLFCSGTFPYRRVAVPAIPPADVKPVLETALEITAQMAGELTVFQSPPSIYTGGEEENKAFEKIKKTVSDMALLYKRKIAASVLTGNPVHEITRAVQDCHLLLLESNEWERRVLFSSILNPDPMVHLLARSPISTLLQPPETRRKEIRSSQKQP